MRKRMLSAIVCIVLLSSTAMYAQDWLTTGNTLGVTGSFGSVDNKKIEFISHNKKRGILTNDGLWGFGNTDPLAQVHINSNDSTRNPLQIDVLDSIKMVVTKGGRVGIGLIAPDARLHIIGGSDVSLGGGGTIVIGPVISTNLALDNNEIQSRNNGAAGTLFLNKDGGDINMGSGSLFLKSTNNFIGIGTTAPAVRLNVDGGTTVALNHGGYIVTGATNAFNLAIDNGAIQARNNGTASLLNLNKDGGDVNISRGALFVDGSNNFVGIGAVPSAQFHVVLGKEATLTDGGYIIAGPTSFKNIVIDADEIQARNNGNSNTLNLNPDGGSIVTGGSLYLGGSELAIKDIFLDRETKGLSIGSNFFPSRDDMYSLGTSISKWLEVWSKDGSINTSDARDKTNIRNLDYGLKEVMQLHPVKFNWKNSENPDDKLGLIAQELQKVLPEVVRTYEYNTNTTTGKKEKIPAEHFGVMYADIIPVLINAIQEQQKEIEALKKAGNNTTSAQPQTSATGDNIINVTLSNNTLDQNVPNPYSKNTSIRYNISSDVKNAFVVISDFNGKIIKQILLNKKGAGIVTIDASVLNAGTYNYALVIDGKTIETKRMVIAK